MLKNVAVASFAVLACGQLLAAPVQSTITPFGASFDDNEQVVLQNDNFNDQGGQAYLQMGFVSGEKAGVWVQVPSNYDYFKVETFRVLIGNSQDVFNMVPSPEFGTQVYFQMGIADATNQAIPAQIENAADVTPGSFWNDIPAQGDSRQLNCARGGQFVGASLEFTHTGLPSVYRDLDGINAKQNTLFAVPGGWNYSVAYGLRGDWILRVTGRKATAEECGA